MLCQVGIHLHAKAVDMVVKELHLSLPLGDGNLVRQFLRYLHLGVYVTKAVLLVSLPLLGIVRGLTLVAVLIGLAPVVDKEGAILQFLHVKFQHLAYLSKAERETEVCAVSHGIVPLRGIQFLAKVLRQTGQFEGHVVRHLGNILVKDSRHYLLGYLLPHSEVNYDRRCIVYTVTEQQDTEGLVLRIFMHSALRKVYL